MGEWIQDTSDEAVDAYVEQLERAWAAERTRTSVEEGESRRTSALFVRLLRNSGLSVLPEDEAKRREALAANLRSSKTVIRFEKGGRLLYLESPEDPTPQIFQWRENEGALTITSESDADAVALITGRLANGRLWLNLMNSIDVAWVRR
jgi:hypothetical protein